MKYHKQLHTLRELHRTVDQIMAKRCQTACHEQSSHIACTKGCHDCCRILCMTTVPDMVLALNELDRRRKPFRFDEGLIARHIGATLGDLQTTDWHALQLDCPFLEQGLCVIYNARPHTCRTHFALTTPDHCKLGYVGHMLVVRSRDIDVEHFVQSEPIARGMGLLSPGVGPLAICLQIARTYRREGPRAANRELKYHGIESLEASAKRWHAVERDSYARAAANGFTIGEPASAP
jgi:Fe-S-cluster containining protein